MCRVLQAGFILVLEDAMLEVCIRCCRRPERSLLTWLHWSFSRQFEITASAFLNLVDVRRLAPAWRMIQSHQLADHAFPGALKSGGNTSVSYYLPYKGTVFIASTTQRCSPWCLINWSLYKDQCFGICKDCVLPSLTDQRKIYHRKLRNSVGSRPRVRQFENWSPHVFSFFQIETCSQNPRTSVHSTQLSFSNMCFSIAWCQTELNLNPAQWTEIKANVPFFWKLTSACWLW